LKVEPETVKRVVGETKPRGSGVMFFGRVAAEMSAITIRGWTTQAVKDSGLSLYYHVT